MEYCCKFPCYNLWASALQTFQKRTGLKYHKDKFDGKLDYLLKQKTRSIRRINKVDKSCHDVNIHNLDITIYTDANLTGWDSNDGISLFRGL